ncbi:MAG: LytR family transcriptional regulator [Candidatus Hydrogenedentota bacterium]|nr:MAG: LytR family transcriptional regulator [Candidatus Hydrogenedentota bacterium]
MSTAGAPSAEALHFLLLGSDRREEPRGRADAIHLLRVEERGITIFSLPRDLLITLPGHEKPIKINHTLALGGSELTARTVEDLLNIKIEGTAVLDMVGFLRIARLTKTVTLNGRLIGAEEIFRHIDGMLAWLRDRSIPGGDLGRLRRQQVFLLHALDWGTSLMNTHPRTFRAFLSALLRSVRTDISEEQILAVGRYFAGYAASSTPDTRPPLPLPLRHVIFRRAELIIPNVLPEWIPLGETAPIPNYIPYSTSKQPESTRSNLGHETSPSDFFILTPLLDPMDSGKEQNTSGSFQRPLRRTPVISYQALVDTSPLELRLLRFRRGAKRFTGRIARM